MRWILVLLVCLVSPVTAFAQANLSKEELTLLTFIDSPDLHSQNPAQRSELLDRDGNVIGYVWRMAPIVERVGLRHAIYAPGFDAQATQAPAVAGSVRSYLELAQQLKVGSASSDNNFPMELIENRNSIVWMIDYLDRQATVQDNSEALQALLQKNNYLTDVGAYNSVLYGYSMGGLIGRHALLSLEDRGSQHNVGAYVSLDAPHRGAFLPPAIEAYSRTLNAMIRNDFSKNTIGTFIRDDIKQVVDSFNSAAARQMLGVYIGRSTPTYKSWPSGNKTNRWRELESYYQSLIADNDLARHPSFYRLREELVDMGSYPTLPLNIGVSFGRADGEMLMPAHQRSHTPLNFRVNLSGNVQLLKAELNSTRGYKLCRVETTGLERSRSCPNLGFYDQHLESVFVGPGSTVNSFGKLFKYVQASELDSNGLRVSGHVDDGEDQLTFVPMVSAFDDKGWARDYPYKAPIGALQTPFDVVIADRSLALDEPGTHQVITKNIINQIMGRIYSSNAHTTQKIRIGGIGNGPASSPSSSYWSKAGVFNIVRYIVPSSVRELPVVVDAQSERFMSRQRDDKSVLAATLSAW